MIRFFDLGYGHEILVYLDQKAVECFEDSHC